MTRFGYLGPIGTFTESALTYYMGIQSNSDTETVPISTLTGLFAALNQGSLDGIMIPFENSIEGPVSASFDQLMTYPDLYISAEVVLPISLCLMRHSDDKNRPITDIVSMPHALAQCSTYITTHYPDASLHHTASTAAAVFSRESLLTNETSRGIGIIGSRQLLDHYPLTLLDDSIQDHPNNSTQFAFISSHLSAPSGEDTTSIVFSTEPDEPGSLMRILQYFSDAGLNLSKVVSRPSKLKLGSYLFFVDVEGHSQTPKLNRVLSDVKKQALSYRELGSYRTYIC